jgi:hypothetical protein
VPKTAKEKARAEVQRAKSKFAGIDSKRDQARIARWEAFEIEAGAQGSRYAALRP